VPQGTLSKELAMDDTTTWRLIHGERATAADILAALTPGQCAEPSLCAGWTVQMTAGHILQAAEQTTGSFMRGMAVSGFRFNTMMDRQARRIGELPMPEIVERLRARTTTTNRPPAPVSAMLGEVVTHTEDICRPLGIAHEASADALVACMEMYKTATFPVGAKKRIAGLRVSATDVDWSYGDGPEVSGPALSLIMAMTGRPAGLSGLEGPGLSTLESRLR
jgi:uncharacterized protein (TIGR03083 family)